MGIEAMFVKFFGGFGKLLGGFANAAGWDVLKAGANKVASQMGDKEYDRIRFLATGEGKIIDEQILSAAYRRIRPEHPGTVRTCETRINAMTPYEQERWRNIAAGPEINDPNKTDMEKFTARVEMAMGAVFEAGTISDEDWRQYYENHIRGKQILRKAAVATIRVVTGRTSAPAQAEGEDVAPPPPSRAAQGLAEAQDRNRLAREAANQRIANRNARRNPQGGN